MFNSISTNQQEIYSQQNIYTNYNSFNTDQKLKQLQKNNTNLTNFINTDKTQNFNSTKLYNSLNQTSIIFQQFIDFIKYNKVPFYQELLKDHKLLFQSFQSIFSNFNNSNHQQNQILLDNSNLQVNFKYIVQQLENPDIAFIFPIIFKLSECQQSNSIVLEQFTDINYVNHYLVKLIKNSNQKFNNQSYQFDQQQNKIYKQQVDFNNTGPILLQNQYKYNSIINFDLTNYTLTTQFTQDTISMAQEQLIYQFLINNDTQIIQYKNNQLAHNDVQQLLSQVCTGQHIEMFCNIYEIVTQSVETPTLQELKEIIQQNQQLISKSSNIYIYRQSNKSILTFPDYQKLIDYKNQKYVKKFDQKDLNQSSILGPNNIIISQTQILDDINSYAQKLKKQQQQIIIKEQFKKSKKAESFLAGGKNNGTLIEQFNDYVLSHKQIDQIKKITLLYEQFLQQESYLKQPFSIQFLEYSNIVGKDLLFNIQFNFVVKENVTFTLFNKYDNGQFMVSQSQLTVFECVTIQEIQEFINSSEFKTKMNFIKDKNDSFKSKMEKQLICSKNFLQDCEQQTNFLKQIDQQTFQVKITNQWADIYSNLYIAMQYDNQQYYFQVTHFVVQTDEQQQTSIEYQYLNQFVNNHNNQNQQHLYCNLIQLDNFACQGCEIEKHNYNDIALYSNTNASKVYKLQQILSVNQSFLNDMKSKSKVLKKSFKNEKNQSSKILNIVDSSLMNYVDQSLMSDIETNQETVKIGFPARIIFHRIVSDCQLTNSVLMGKQMASQQIIQQFLTSNCSQFLKSLKQHIKQNNPIVDYNPNIQNSLLVQLISGEYRIIQFQTLFGCVLFQLMLMQVNNDLNITLSNNSKETEQYYLKYQFLNHAIDTNYIYGTSLATIEDQSNKLQFVYSIKNLKEPALIQLQILHKQSIIHTSKPHQLKTNVNSYVLELLKQFNQEVKLFNQYTLQLVITSQNGQQIHHISIQYQKPQHNEYDDSLEAAKLQSRKKEQINYQTIFQLQQQNKQVDINISSQIQIQVHQNSINFSNFEKKLNLEITKSHFSVINLFSEKLLLVNNSNKQQVVLNFMDYQQQSNNYKIDEVYTALLLMFAREQ